MQLVPQRKAVTFMLMRSGYNIKLVHYDSKESQYELTAKGGKLYLQKSLESEEPDWMRNPEADFILAQTESFISEH